MSNRFATTKFVPCNVCGNLGVEGQQCVFCALRTAPRPIISPPTSPPWQEIQYGVDYKRAFEQLQERHKLLDHQHTLLQSEHAALQEEHADLTTNFAKLKEAFVALRARAEMFVEAKDFLNRRGKELRALVEEELADVQL